MELIVIILSLIASAFFSGMEIAFVSANRLKIELDKNQGTISGKILSYFVKHSPKFISTMLLGNNIALVVYGIFMAILIEPKIEWFTQSKALILIIQTLISTAIVLVTAEFLPKAIFRINPNRSLSLGSVVLFIIYWILFIPTFIVTLFSKLFLKLFKVDISASEQAFTKLDLDYYVRDINDRMENKADMENEIQILQNALEFNKLKARDCMIPRTEILALNIEESIDVLKEKFIESGFSKILIYRDSMDNIIGYVHSFELFKKPNSIKQILLPITIVPEAILAKDLLEQFSKQKRSIALVVDEYGGTSGMVTVEDVIEEIFGEIEDEHDEDELTEEKLNDDEFMFSARLEIDYINQEYGLNIEENDEYGTLGGFILNRFEDIPKIGQSFEYRNYIYEIVDVSDTRVELVKVFKD